jgi:uncharacterized damage-inducible protein DinB
MDALYVMRRLARNEAWANHRLHVAIAQLPADAYRQTGRTSFFPSIHLTLSHLLHVARYYVDALVEGGEKRAIWDDLDRCDREGTFPEIQLHQSEVDRALLDWLDGLTDPAELEVPVALERRDHIQRESRGDVLLHLFEHQIHHRGQVHAMLSGTAVAPPQLDEFFLREELPLRRAELEALGLPLE